MKKAQGSAFRKAAGGLDKAEVLILEAHMDMKTASSILEELKASRPIKNINPLSSQGEMFSFLPENNEKLEHICLESLVDTL